MTFTLLSFEFTAINRTHESDNYVVFGGISPFSNCCYPYIYGYNTIKQYT